MLMGLSAFLLPLAIKVGISVRLYLTANYIFSIMSFESQKTAMMNLYIPIISCFLSYYTYTDLCKQTPTYRNS
jgi:hypothetical protein